MTGNYLTLLEESLRRKLQVKLDVLGHIEEIGQVQTEILKKETFDMEAFDRTVDEKDAFVTELIKLDEGFESLYDRIKEEFARDKSSYAGQIKHLQKLISEITDKNVSIQAEESRNKAMLENYFAKERQGSQILQCRLRLLQEYEWKTDRFCFLR